jgi:arylsulfatase
VNKPAKSEPRVSAEFASVLDVVPTLYELAQIEYAAADSHKDVVPLMGESMLPYLEGKSDRVHDASYTMGWELFGRAAFRQGPWKIVSIERPFGTGTFELFHLDRDPGETEDVSSTHPEVLRELLGGWGSYAKQVNVLTSRDLGISDATGR